MKGITFTSTGEYLLVGNHVYRLSKAWSTHTALYVGDIMYKIGVGNE